MKLEAINKGSKVFIDANILTYHLSGHSLFGRACRDFLRNVERGDYKVFMNDIVLSEIHLNFMKAELFKSRGIEPHKLVHEMKQKPDLIEFVNFDVITNLFEVLQVKILPIEYTCEEIVRFITRYRLLPNDAIHVATMERYGITNIATNDSDFERVKSINVWKP